MLLMLALAGPAFAGKFTAAITEGTRIDVTYTPSTNCNKVVLIQTMKASVSKEDGTMSVDLDYKNWDALEHVKDDQIADNTTVDHKFCEKDPYVNGGTDAQDTDGVAGKKTATTTTDATFGDKPNANAPKQGKNKFTSLFEICAFCADTNPPMAFNECMTWTYMNTKSAAATSMITGGTGAGNALAPSASFTSALTQFNTNHNNNSKCPEKEAADAVVGENGRALDVDSSTIPPPGQGEGGVSVPALGPPGMLVLALILVSTLLWIRRSRSGMGVSDA